MIPAEAAPRRGFLVLALVLLLVAAIVDLLRRDSLLLGTWDRLNPGGTRLERTIDRAQRIRPGAQRVNLSPLFERALPARGHPRLG